MTDVQAAEQPSRPPSPSTISTNLKGSQRTVNKATFVPTRLVHSRDVARPARPLEALAFLRGLALSESEISSLSSPSPREIPDGSGTVGESVLPELNPEVLALAREVSQGNRPGGIRRFGARAAAVSFADLAALGEAVVALRQTPSQVPAPEVQGATSASQVPVAVSTGSVAGAQAMLAVLLAAMHAPNEPVGRLHLERLEMTPAGVEHGELVHSVPMTPKETVNISHREWSVTTSTFESIVQDSFEGFSETGVTDKTDLSQATQNETTHSSALDINGSVTANYNGGAYSVTAAASVSSSTKDDSHTTNKSSIAHSQAITKHASARTRKDHKTSFRVSSVAGAEDLAVRTLTNPSDKPIRVDYFQLMRKWQVDLIRYGLRLTYDLVIPAPGSDLIGPVLELQQITQMLTTATFTFPLSPSDIEPYDTTSDKYYVKLAAQYAAAIEPPLAQTGALPLHKEFTIDKDHRDTQFLESTEIDVDPSYQVDSGSSFDIRVVSFHQPAQLHFELIGYKDFGGAGGQTDLVHLYGKSGKLSLEYWYQGLAVFLYHVNIKTKITDAAVTAWQLKAWAALREAAQADFDRRITLGKDRKAYLEEQLAQFDALTLRRMEHEEVMKWTLQWLLGPNFRLMPQSISNLATDSAPTSFAGDPVTAEGKPVTIKVFDPTTDPEVDAGPPPIYAIPEEGDVVKFLQEAIEWENALFFVYPYFWDHSQNWPFKKFLIHPDPVHRDFLRGGAARVVLTVRPGWEDAFTRFAISGKYDASDYEVLDHPYMTIAQEIQNQALTNYENIPPANPDRSARPLLYPQQRAAWSDMQTIMLAVEYFYNKHLKYPADNEIPALIPMLKAEPQTIQTVGGSIPSPAANILQALETIPGAPNGVYTDPWGNPYHYESPSIYGDYGLVSYGKDGKPGGEDKDPLNADITSWAEGSTVARWYEYTPTSALDVSVSPTLPLGGPPLAG